MGIIEGKEGEGVERAMEQRTKIINMLEYTKMHVVVLKHDMKKGQQLRVRCKVSVPKDIYDEIVADIIQNHGRRILTAK